MNFASQPLQRHEIRLMRAEPTIIQRVLQSYRLMLDFYGMRLVSADTGLIERVLPPRNYEARYQNLLRESRNGLPENTHSHPLPPLRCRSGSTHNNLRITRILKCLSELGLERLNAGFLLHVLSEQSEERELDSRTIRSSMDRWWAHCVRDPDERAWIGRMIRQVRAKEQQFTFTREMYRDALERRRARGSLGDDGLGTGTAGVRLLSADP
jgi:hypothetical protein